MLLMKAGAVDVLFGQTGHIRSRADPIDNQLADFNKKYNLDMKLGLGSVGVESFKLRPGQIEAIMVSRFYLEVGIRDLRSFNRF